MPIINDIKEIKQGMRKLTRQSEVITEQTKKLDEFQETILVNKLRLVDELEKRTRNPSKFTSLKRHLLRGSVVVGILLLLNYLFGISLGDSSISLIQLLFN
jgi:hypothetical protein